MDPDPLDPLLQHNRILSSILGLGVLPPEPALRLALVTCMDPRIDPRRLLGVKEGDVHHLRNAGGSVTDDTIRSLIVSQRLLGTRSVMLVHHTGCGMMTFTDEQLDAQIEIETGSRPAMPFGAFSDPEADLRESMYRLRACPYLPHRDDMRGFVLDMASGRLREVTIGSQQTV
jgi:carbonic anhydrase